MRTINKKTVLNDRKFSAVALLNEINRFFDVDIRANTRKHEVITARKIFFVKAKQMGLSLSKIGNMCNRSHSMVWVANTQHNQNYAHDNIYRVFWDDFNNYKKPVERPIMQNKVLLDVLSDLKTLSDTELLEFKETRLKPFLMMLNNKRVIN